MLLEIGDKLWFCCLPVALKFFYKIGEYLQFCSELSFQIVIDILISMY